MQTQRDHLQAYQFAMGRLAAALVTGQPGNGGSPYRRGSVGTFFGVVLVLLLCVGFAVWGLIDPVEKNTWRQPGSIIVEEQTGNRYLLLDGTLRPVRNYASALLLTGLPGTVRTASQEDLKAVPHGSPVGIDKAPDSLPTPGNVASGGWTRCLRPDLPTREVLDLTPSGTTPVSAGTAAVVADRSGHRFVLWRGVKYSAPTEGTLIALGLDGGRPVTAPDDWLAEVPSGVPLRAPAVPHDGDPAGRIGDEPVRVGQVLRTSDAQQPAYVMLKDGIARVTATEAALLASRPGAPAPATVDAASLAAAPVAPHRPAATLPDLRGAPLSGPAGALCLRQTTSGVHTTNSLVREWGSVVTARRPVLVAPAHGVLVVDQDDLSARATSPRTYLIDDQGILFRLSGRAAQDLRLSGPTTAMPGRVLKLLPNGPLLSPDAAMATVKGK
ncbi:type VII secretion protein EccB [Streptomyces sp. NPDC004658]|uniref:type VII secretion protein EccB n=1 Tax=Streptomyces sp. NPDC004658 TaxID=3154672 RepID=UPI0033A5687A